MIVYTIGHGARTLEDFIATLRAADVCRVVDVRRHPASRRHPHFAREALAQSLQASDIDYAWLLALGGRRPPGGRPSPNPAWRVAAFRAYADYMDTDAFATGLAQLLALAAERASAVMCAETHPSQCHRRLIADKLASLGHDVVHLLSAARREAHVVPAFLRVEGGRLRYDVVARSNGQQSLV